MAWYWLGEPFLYLCFAVLAGWLILLHKIPRLIISRKMILFSALGVAVFAFIPVLRIVLFFSGNYGFGHTLQNVLFRLNEGRAYLLTLFFVVAFCLTITFARPERKPRAWFFCILLFIAVIFSQGLVSHAAVFHGVFGGIPHVLHLCAVSVWSGTLFMAGLYVPVERWNSFLTWFHPTAMLAMFVLVVSGLMLMVFTVPEYVHSWVLPFGQALLLKHLFLVPIFVFAFFHGWWMRKKIARKENFNPKPWVIAEAIFILLIFAITGFMSQQPAPHDVSQALSDFSVSPLYAWLHGEITEMTSFHWNFNSVSIISIGLSMLSLLYMIFSVFKTQRPLFAIVSGLVFAVFAFISAVSAIHIGVH